jgi:glutamate formiminotransferase
MKYEGLQRTRHYHLELVALFVAELNAPHLGRRAKGPKHYLDRWTAIGPKETTDLSRVEKANKFNNLLRRLKKQGWKGDKTPPKTGPRAATKTPARL